MGKYHLLDNSFYVIKNNSNYYIYLKGEKLLFFLSYKNICIYRNYLYFLNFKFFTNIFNYFFFSWNNYIIKKIKFKHKITWLYLYRNNLNLLKITTNISKKIFFIINNFKLKRKKNHFSLHSLVFWGVNLLELNILLSRIINILYYNSYTRKGFKLARSKLISRVGKVSKYKGLKGKVF